MTTTPTQPERVRFSVPLDKLEISPLNTRSRAPAQIESVAKTIKAAGIIFPPIVRSSRARPEDGFEILDGGYRFLGAQKARLKEIEVELEECNDERARQIILTSTERHDMHPLDQAEQVAQLLPKLKTEKRVGDALGKSAEWVKQRLSLATLAEPWKKAWRDPECDLLKFSLDAWAELASSPEKLQLDLWRNEISQADEGGSDDDPNLRPLCYSAGDELSEPFTTGWLRSQIKYLTQGGRKLAFTGAAAGKDDSSADRAGGWTQRPKAAKPAVSLKERRKQLQKRRLALVIKGIHDIVGQMTTFPEKSPLRRKAFALAAAVVAFGSNRRLDQAGMGIYEHLAKGSAIKAAKLPQDPWDRLQCYMGTVDNDRMLIALADAMAEDVFNELTPVLLKRIDHYQVSAIDLDVHGRECEEICKVFCLDYADLCAQAEREIQEPKSWANLKADGTPKATPAKKPKQDAAKRNKGVDRADAEYHNGDRVKAGKQVTYRVIGNPAEYVMPKAKFLREMQEACIRETGDELKAGAITDEE